MKATVKYIMGPLFLGGLVITLYFCLIAFHLRKNHTITGNRGNYTATHLLKSDVASYCISIMKKILPCH